MFEAILTATQRLFDCFSHILYPKVSEGGRAGPLPPATTGGYGLKTAQFYIEFDLFLRRWSQKFVQIFLQLAVRFFIFFGIPLVHCFSSAGK